MKQYKLHTVRGAMLSDTSYRISSLQYKLQICSPNNQNDKLFKAYKLYYSTESETLKLRDTIVFNSLLCRLLKMR
jgi:hypothetical protein